MSIHVLIPAGGSGSRFGASVPKQFLALQGRLVLEWSLAPFLAEPAINHIWVALTDQVPEDAEQMLARLRRRHPGRLHCLDCAGASRAITVANALELIAEHSEHDDPWVLVHDAARPGLGRAALDRLLAALQTEPVGALLAVPLADTLKQAEARADGAAQVAATVPRAGLWQAQTPQAFRLGLLQRALRAAGDSVTDEASAVEALGLAPLLVEGDPRNLKLTRPSDALLLDALLAAQEEHPCG